MKGVRVIVGVFSWAGVPGLVFIPQEVSKQAKTMLYAMIA